ncbi:MAG: hypothetical protein D3906_00260 [Candidatus Electrothrix sp. AUS1_2]|nr:hypothetical protein [Candidatus Electrothrix sp. AUS1_2]
MDTVSIAIIAGLVAGITKVGEQAAVDAYKALKAALRKKCGSNSDVVEAVEYLEKKPDAKARQAGVAEEIKAAKVHEDADLIRAAETLLAALNSTPTGQQVVAKYGVNVTNAGVVGENAHVEGGIHFGGN